MFPRVKYCYYEPREKRPRIPANSQTRTPMSLLRTPTKRNFGPRHAKFDFWPMKIRKKIGIYKCLCQDQSVSRGQYQTKQLNSTVGNTKRVWSDWVCQMTLLPTRNLWFSNYDVVDNLGCSLLYERREFALTPVTCNNYACVRWFTL